MRLPDRPVLNVVLGVVFALIVLGFLSWPGIVGTKQAAPPLVSNSNVNSASSGQSLSSSSVSSSLSAPNNTTTMISTLASSETLAAQTRSIIPAPSNSVVGSGSNVSTSSYGSTNSPFPASSLSSLSNTTLLTVSSGKDSVVGQLQTNATTVVQPGTTTTLPSGNFSSSSSASNFGEPALAPQSFSYSGFSALTILTLGAVIVGVGSMIFVHRKVDSEDSEN